MRRLYCKCTDGQTVLCKRRRGSYFECTKCGAVIHAGPTSLDFGQKDYRRITFWLNKYKIKEKHTLSATVRALCVENKKLQNLTTDPPRHGCETVIIRLEIPAGYEVYGETRLAKYPDGIEPGQYHTLKIPIRPCMNKEDE